MAKVADEEMGNEEEQPHTWKVMAEQLAKEEQPKLRKVFSNSNLRLLLFPDDQFVNVWGLIMFGMLMFVAVFTPYRVALVMDDTTEWLILDTIVDGMFFIDLILNFFSAYYDSEKNLITSHRTICVNYAKTWLIPDFLACLPIQYLQGVGSYNSLVRLSRIPRIYRLVRMFRLMRMLKLIRHSSSVMRYMTHFFRISLGMERLFWFAITLVFMIHLSACAWAFVGRFDSDIDPVNWIAIFGYQDRPNLELYVISVYWTITTVATVGYGDITATNNFERASNSCIMLLGVLVYSYMVGALTNVISSLDSRKAKLTRNLESLAELAKEYHLGKAFYSKLTNAIEYEHRNNNKEMDWLVASLPNHLRTQLLVIIHRKKIENNTFFEGRSQHFVVWILSLLKSMMLEYNEYVYKAGDLAMEMYFLIKGEVDFVVTVVNGVDLGYVSMQAGYYFGEIELLFSPEKLRIHTTKTKARVELLCFTGENFEKLMKSFEMEGLEILSVAEERRKRMEKTKNEAMEAYKLKRKVSRKMSIPLDPATRRTRALQYKKQLEGEMEVSSFGDNDLSECKLSDSPSEGHSDSLVSSESVTPRPTVTPHSTRHINRGHSLLNTAMYERLKTKITGNNEKDLNRLQKQINMLSGSLKDMQAMIGNLSEKFNLRNTLGKEDESSSQIRVSRSLRKLSVERTPNSASASISNSSSEGSPNAL